MNSLPADLYPVTVWLKYDVNFFLENGGRKAREEKPGSFETERRERTRGENGQTVGESRNQLHKTVTEIISCI